jgi:PhnB protein
MSIKSLNPYLNFDGTAEKAIQLYERALGAKAENLMRFGDMQGAQVSPEHKNRIMHARLNIGGGVVMVSDVQPGMPAPKQSNTHVLLDFDDSAEMTKKFDALAAGGRVTMPLQETFWGARFGMLTDPYGIQWMFNCELKKS